MGRMKELYQQQLAILASQLEMGGRIFVLTYDEVQDLDEMIQNVYEGTKTLEVKALEGMFQVEAIPMPQTQNGEYVSLDADHMIHLHAVLNQHHKSIYQQLETMYADLKELHEAIEDNQRLRVKLETNQVTRQDIETFEVIEQEMEELYGS